MYAFLCLNNKKNMRKLYFGQHALRSQATFANISLSFILCLLTTKFQTDQMIIKKIIYFCRHFKICTASSFITGSVKL